MTLASAPRPAIPRILRNPHRRKILRALYRRRARFQPAPSWEHLARELDISITNARHHARMLRRSGLVVYHDGEMRTLVITKDGAKMAQNLLHR